MTFTYTPPTEPIVKGSEKHEIWALTAGAGTETAITTITAKFLRRIKRTVVHDMEVAARVITPVVGNAPPTFSATIEAGPTEGFVELIGD